MMKTPIHYRYFFNQSEGRSHYIDIALNTETILSGNARMFHEVPYNVYQRIGPIPYIYKGFVVKVVPKYFDIYLSVYHKT